MAVIENLWKKPEMEKLITRWTTDGFIIEGKAFHVAPLNQRTIVDLTTPPGKASGILLGFFFWLGKKGFHIEKIQEWMEISPVHAPYYEITIRQKQALEGQIKTGLAGIATAVSDLELLLHDLRKYKEFMDYFEKIEKGKKEKKPELVAEGEQTLKAIFIDQVDVHTGERIALKLIAPRWPTIIADFMKLMDEDIEAGKIAKKLKVSEAEGVVLATKNKLYMEWRGMFRDTVKGRYTRIKAMVEARKKSVQEYRNMLRPYITRYRSIRELGETPEGRRILESIAWYRPAAHAISFDISTVWAWKSYHPPELFKTSPEVSERPVNILKIPFPRGFKENIKKYIKEKEFAAKYGKLPLSPTGIEPLDEFVLQFIPDIESHYKIKFTVPEILDARKKLFETSGRDPYFMVLEVCAARTVMKMPDGTELEDLWLEPFRSYMDTQNVVLLRILELKAREKELENYIKQMLGESAELREKPGAIKSIEDITKEEYPLVLGGIERIEEVKKPVKVAKVLKGAVRYVIKPGPYETTFDDRISGAYFREVANELYKPALTFLKTAVAVPGFKVI